jgi:exopolyphosphatase/guanosine-5'-triphosphate,3'-diphosphate pyrophosphatase
VKCLHAHYAHHLAGGPNQIGAWVADRVEPIHEAAPGRVAAVDMGTNSIRLLVADPTDDDIAEISRDLVITRLGQGVDRTGRLDPGALDRTLEVLARYARRARALGAERIRVGATSAVRDASNRERLFEEVERVAGASAEVLTGEREAALSFLGATADAPANPPYLVFDIGGGSTEFALGTEGPEAVVSVDLGSVRAHERVAPADPPTPEDLEAMDGVVAEGLVEAEAAIPRRAATLVGVAGTTTTVQGIALGLDSYDPEALHGSVLTLAEAERVSAELAAMTVAERAAIPVMTPGREDVIVAGTRILLGIFRTFGFEECLVSERDILDGLALEMVRSRKPDGTR